MGFVYVISQRSISYYDGHIHTIVLFGYGLGMDSKKCWYYLVESEIVVVILKTGDAVYPLSFLPREVTRNSLLHDVKSEPMALPVYQAGPLGL